MNTKILIVDDSSLDRFIIKNMLSDYNVLTACDGFEAMDILEKDHDIDIMILDINMPNMDGFEVLKSLKTKSGYDKLRTIILTNYDELEKEIQGLNLGAVDFIRKPVNLDSLRIRIKIHVELLNIQRLLEKELNKTNLLVDTIFDQAPIGITLEFGMNPNSNNNDSNPVINKSFEKITGRSRDELIKLGWGKITHPDDLEKDLENYEKFLNGDIESYNMEKRYLKPDGTTAWVDMTIAPIKIDSSPEINHICLVQDITERKEHEMKLKYISEHDLNTGLYNRRYFESLLEEEKKIKSDLKRAAVLLNLKNINFVNLTYGYDFNEKIVKELATMLSNLEDENTMVFSISFDRFLFYIKGYNDSMELNQFCEKLLELIKEIQILHIVGCEIGVLKIERNNFDGETILRKALVAAETVGVHEVFSYQIFNDELDKKMKREEKVRSNLLDAIYNEKDKMYVQYQPILDLKTNKIRGFEVLVRMDSEELGIIPPIEFIHLAEEMQLIVPVGKRVTKLACEFLKKLEKEGYDDICVYINVSIAEIYREEFISELIEMVENTNVNTKCLGIEITETIFSNNNDFLNLKLEKLMRLGIKVSIDDFGMGHSTFSRESDLKVNCLKIDKSFIDKLMTVKHDESITGDIISMAHRLGHIVVAEGVEYEIQKEYLIENKCDLLQGFLFSKPLYEKDAIDFLKKINI